jgi:hypothetical protein
MKKLIAILLFASSAVWADECRVTSATAQIGSELKTETITVCKEGEMISQRIKVGDTVLETEVGQSNVRVGYFKYRNSTCKLFTERLTEKGKLRVNHGVICQIDNSPTNWLVVDKW